MIRLKNAAVAALDAVLGVGTRFLTALAILGALVLYVLIVVPVDLYIGAVSPPPVYWQDGGPFLSFLGNEFVSFVALPLAPLVVAFAIAAAAAWLLSKDAARSRAGFRGVIATAFVIALGVTLPSHATVLIHRVEANRSVIAHDMHPTGAVNVGPEPHSAMAVQKIYRSLHEAGIDMWREDAVSVVRYELAYGELRHLHEEDDAVRLLWDDEDPDSGYSTSAVEVRNARGAYVVTLTSPWNDNHRVWMVRRYEPSR